MRTGTALTDEGTDALYAHTGVIEVPTVTALLDTARTLSTQPLMDGRRVCRREQLDEPDRARHRRRSSAAGLEVVDPPQPAHVAQHVRRLPRGDGGGDRRSTASTP